MKDLTENLERISLMALKEFDPLETVLGLDSLQEFKSKPLSHYKKMVIEHGPKPVVAALMGLRGPNQEDQDVAEYSSQILLSLKESNIFDYPLSCNICGFTSQSESYEICPSCNNLFPTLNQ